MGSGQMWGLQALFAGRVCGLQESAWLLSLPEGQTDQVLFLLDPQFTGL